MLFELFNVSFYNSECTLIQTNIKQFQGLYKTDIRTCFNQVLIKFLNCFVFSAVFHSRSEFQIIGRSIRSNKKTCKVN